MPHLTPIRVRGKRKATKDMESNIEQPRKAKRTATVSGSERSSSSFSTQSAERLPHRRRRRQEPELSRLEQLPSEVLQEIFEYSANTDLPLVSAHLASQLKSRHLYHTLTTNILATVIGDRESTTDDLRAASRLMNSKFFTWTFFQSWLRDEYDRRSLDSEWQAAASNSLEQWTWHKLRPSARLPPPTKVLRAPFTEDRIAFLQLIGSLFRGHPYQLDPLYVERANEGFHQAIVQNATETLHSFWLLGMQPDTELLRIAVIDSGCDKATVHALVMRALDERLKTYMVNFLDPSLWSWAEKAQAQGSEKGPWLKKLLRNATRDCGRKLPKAKDSESS